MTLDLANTVFELANQDDRYVWTDFESTGLDEDVDCLIQVAAIMTDGELRELDTFETLVAPFPSCLENMNDYVREMHTKNGLLEALRTGNPPTVESAGNAFRDWLSRYKMPSGDLYLAGNSIHGVDLPFSRTYMPQIHMDHKEMVNGELLGGPLHYRALDVTSIRLALRLWTGYDFHYQKDGMHNAISDVRQCLDEFKFFKKCARAFFTGDIKDPTV